MAKPAPKQPPAPTEFVIEYDIEIPASSFSGDRRSRYPFHDMRVGGSFLVPWPDDLPKAGRKVFASRLTNSTASLRRRGWRFVQRSLDDGLRIWRVEDGEPKPAKRAPAHVVIEVKSGRVASMSTDANVVEVTVIDWDEVERGEDRPDLPAGVTYKSNKRGDTDLVFGAGWHVIE